MSATVDGPSGDNFSDKRAKELAADGCIVCGDKGKTFIYDDKRDCVVCPPCMGMYQTINGFEIDQFNPKKKD